MAASNRSGPFVGVSRIAARGGSLTLLNCLLCHASSVRSGGSNGERSLLFARGPDGNEKRVHAFTNFSIRYTSSPIAQQNSTS